MRKSKLKRKNGTGRTGRKTGQDKTARAGSSGQDYEDTTARTGWPGQDSQHRTVRT
jgi:hypothetical protein